MVPNFINNPIGRILAPNYVPAYQNASASAFRIDASTDGVAYLFVAGKSEKIVDVYIYVNAYAGTPPTLTLTLAAFTSTSAIGSDLANYSATATGRSSGPGWVKFTFTNGSRAALVAGTAYYAKVTSNGDASNYNDVGTGFALIGTAGYDNWTSFTTTNSFSTITMSTRQGVPLVLKYDSGFVQGQPYTKASTDTSNTYKRGLYIPAMDAPLLISGVVYSTITGNTNFEIWRVGQGSADATISMAAGSGPSGSTFVMPEPQTLLAGVDYRLLITYSVSSTRPGSVEIEDPDDYADLLAARYGGGWFKTEHDGSNWVDSTKKFPCMVLTIASGAAGAGGGGSSGDRARFGGNFQ